MDITDFIKSLDEDREFKLQLAGEKYVHPVMPQYMKLDLDERLRKFFENKGINLFYSHQVKAIDLIRQGENVVLMTPTASGKTLVYNIPVIESVFENPDARSLYIFPLKGLEQDQLKNLNELSGALGLDNTGDVYDGDTPAQKRREIREALPNVIFTNPDMLHLALLPFHRKWEEFFRNLKYVVIDEIHSYRGVFGSNVAQVFRRLRRICDQYGAGPQFIAASATIANPERLTEELTGLPFKLIDESGAPSAGKMFFFVDPVESPYSETTRIFVKCLKAGIRTIVFTKSRKITELIYSWALNYAPEFEGMISPYRAGFLPKERREIESRLFSGELLGVITTSALELGVDIGGLDCCILCGYPGSVSSTWQRAGRVGRQDKESLVVLVAIQDALDKYFMRHTDEFFEKSHEAAVIDPLNRNIIRKHLECAAAELPLRKEELIFTSEKDNFPNSPLEKGVQEVVLSMEKRQPPLSLPTGQAGPFIKGESNHRNEKLLWSTKGEQGGIFDFDKLEPIINELVSEKILLPTKKGDAWYSKNRRPHRDVGIRAIGERFMLMNESGRAIGELSGSRVFREAFPGAIYLHRGKQYLITELDIKSKRAVCRAVNLQYYTQALSSDTTEIIETIEKISLRNLDINWGKMKITQQITGYDRKRGFDNTRISSHVLNMPEHIFETEGLWMVIDNKTKSEMETEGFDLGGTIHAAEHALIAAIPLFALCDRGDIGGLSHTCFPEFSLPAIFVYDGHEGGVGLTKRALEIAEEWFSATLKIIEECPCSDGCPSCVQDPQCGNRNNPLDKHGAKFLLKRWPAV
jgi:DEAD/DEAH box helicase domain-containing protein